jgi:hypothetical protein
MWGGTETQKTDRDEMGMQEEEEDGRLGGKVGYAGAWGVAGG